MHSYLLELCIDVPKINTPLNYASPEIIEFIVLTDNRKSDQFVDTMCFFSQLNLQPPYSLCSKLDTIIIFGVHPLSVPFYLRMCFIKNTFSYFFQKLSTVTMLHCIACGLSAKTPKLLETHKRGKGPYHNNLCVTCHKKLESWKEHQVRGHSKITSSKLGEGCSELAVCSCTQIYCVISTFILHSHS